MNNRLFIDTSYLLALVSQRDKYHAIALEYADRLNEAAVTSNAVLLELGNSLAKGEMRKLAIATIAELRSDPQIEIVTISPAIMDEALQLFASRMDKEWGLVDCTSFVIMRQNRLTHALTVDRQIVIFYKQAFKSCFLSPKSDATVVPVRDGRAKSSTLNRLDQRGCTA